MSRDRGASGRPTALTVRHVIAPQGTLPLDPGNRPVSGVAKAVLSIGREQARTGHSVEIWGWNPDTVGESRWEDIRLWAFPHWAWARLARWDFRWLAPVGMKALRSAPVDVIHAHVDPNLLYLPRARRRLLHLHTPIPDPFPPAYRKLLGRADGVVACSDFIRDRFLDASGYDPERTFTVHNGADPAPFDPVVRRAQRAEWELPDDVTVVLFAGAIVPQKGVAPLVRAFAQLQDVVPGAWLVIVGGSELWASPSGTASGASYEGDVRRAAEGMRVKFVGSVSNGRMAAAYMASDIVAVPSVWDEPHAIVLCEAMAAGRPVIASRAGGIPETVVDGETGLLVPPGDERRLRDALVTLAVDADLRERMGRSARLRATDFTWTASSRRLEAIYAEVLDRAGRSVNDST